MLLPLIFNDSVTAPHIPVNLSTKQVGTVFCESHLLLIVLLLYEGKRNEAHFVQSCYWSAIQLYPGARL